METEKARTVYANASTGRSAPVRHDMQRLLLHVLAWPRKWEMRNKAPQRVRITGAPRSGAARLQSQDPCADLLREQIAQAKAALAPGGAWDRQITEAERRLKELQTERNNIAHSVVLLQEALLQVTRSGKKPEGRQAVPQSQRPEHDQPGGGGGLDC